MNDTLYIDGVNAYDAYRLSVSDGDYKDFVCFPKLKDIAFNDWHEQNGIDPDLTSPVLNSKDITVNFYISGELSRYEALMQALSDGAYHLFHFQEIGLQIRLRMVKSGNVSSVQNLYKFSITFSDDFPLDEYEYDAPSSALVPKYDYLIDGVNISNYGVIMLKGTYDEIIKQPDVKENLKVNLKHLPGQIYDGQTVTYKTRTVALKCLMRASSLDEFWHNWKALLYDLIRPEARMLRVTKLGKDIPFYYKSCSVNCFFPDKGKIWFEFTLNVEFFKGVI